MKPSVFNTRNDNRVSPSMGRSGRTVGGRKEGNAVAREFLRPRFTSWREARGWSLERTAEACGVTKGTLSLVVNGKGSASQGLIDAVVEQLRLDDEQRMAWAVGCSLAALPEDQAGLVVELYHSSARTQPQLVELRREVSVLQSMVAPLLDAVEEAGGTPDGMTPAQFIIDCIKRQSGAGDETSSGMPSWWHGSGEGESQ